MPDFNVGDVINRASDTLIGTGNPLIAPLGVAGKAYANKEQLAAAAAEAKRIGASNFRHAANAASHAGQDLALKMNPDASFLDHTRNVIGQGIDNVKVAAQDAYDWAELNPGKAAGIAAGVPIALAGSYYLYKKMKDRQNGGRK